MRDILDIKRDIEALRYEIRMARRDDTSDTEMEELYQELDILQDELQERQLQMWS